jgi:nicotinamidase-related amidase
MHGEMLLVIDVQNGFISDKTRFVVNRIRDLISANRFSNIAFTQFINTDASQYERFLDWSNLKSPQEQLITEELRDHAEIVFQKGEYSVVNNEFKEYLSQNKIHTVYLTGIDIDCCVLASSFGIFDMGIRPIVLAYYCASNGGSESYEAALRVLERTIGPKQITMDKFI